MVSEFFRNYIEECKNLLINNTPIVKQDTIKKYSSVFNHWLNFEEFISLVSLIKLRQKV